LAGFRQKGVFTNTSKRACTAKDAKDAK